MALRIRRLFRFGGLLAAGPPRRGNARRGSLGIAAGSLAFLAAAGLVGATSTGSLFAACFSLYAHLVRPISTSGGLPPKLPIASSGAAGAAVSAAVEPTAPAPPAQPPTPTLSAADVGRAIGRGEALVRGGEIEAARFFFQLAADAGNRQAAFRLAETFDPAFAPYQLGSNDWRAARFWYQRALALGDADAASRIAQLDAHPPR